MEFVIKLCSGCKILGLVHGLCVLKLCSLLHLPGLAKVQSIQCGSLDLVYTLSTGELSHGRFLPVAQCPGSTEVQAASTRDYLTAAGHCPHSVASHSRQPLGKHNYAVSKIYSYPS